MTKSGKRFTVLGSEETKEEEFHGVRQRMQTGVCREVPAWASRFKTIKGASPPQRRGLGLLWLSGGELVGSLGSLKPSIFAVCLLDLILHTWGLTRK